MYKKMCQLAVHVIGKASSKQQGISSEGLGESKVILIFSTLQGSEPLTPTVFKSVVINNMV